MNSPVESRPSARPEGDGSALYGVAIALGQSKWAILGFTVGLMILVALGTLLIPNSYTARSLLLPPQQGQSSAGSALAALGVVSMGLGGAVGVKSPEELYVSLLRSDSVSDALIERFKLKERYDEEKIINARKALAKRVLVTAERKSGLIKVEVEDHEPAFAAELANAYSQELRQLMNRIAITEASQRRLFFEQQAERAKEVLAKAEMAFKDAQAKYGIQSIDVRAQGDIQASSQLRAQIMAREVQLQSMASFAGPENADVRRLASEMRSLREQLNKLETGTGADSPNSEAALANQRAYREVKYQEALLSGLITQTELARGDEARQAPLVQQVDVARPPDIKSGPKRASVTLVAGILGLLLAAAFVLVKQILNGARADASDSPAARRWRSVRAAWKLRSGL